MAFKIITDSATDLPKEIVEKYKLHVIPTPVTIDGTDYFDGKTIFPEDFYRIQAQGTDIKTYHINQYMFRENFEPYAKAGDEVLYMCFSTGIAGTFNAANLAKEELLEEYPEFDLTIIDTKCASLGFGLAVEKILRMQANGAPKDLIIEAAQFFCEHMEHIVTVETLEKLYQNGDTAALAGFLQSAEVLFEDCPIVRLAPFYEKLALNGAEIYLKRARIPERLFEHGRFCRLYKENGGFYAVAELGDYPDGAAVKIKYRF